MWPVAALWSVRVSVVTPAVLHEVETHSDWVPRISGRQRAPVGRWAAVVSHAAAVGARLVFVGKTSFVGESSGETLGHKKRDTCRRLPGGIWAVTDPIAREGASDPILRRGTGGMKADLRGGPSKNSHCSLAPKAPQ